MKLLLIPALALLLGFLISLMFEAFRRRSTTSSLLHDAYPCFEDPKSRKKVPYPSIFDPAEKYISLIIPAFNEEQRLPSALEETMVYLQQRAENDKDFSYESYSIDNVRVIPLGRNQGKGEAIRKGMLHSRGFHIVVLLSAGGSGIRDTQCGFKMFTRAAARKIFKNVRLKRWCFDVELVYLCKQLSIPMIEMSVTWSEIPGSKVSLRSILHMLGELCLMSVGYRTGIWSIRV
ncbi:hypothetical protein MKW92_051583 [Papaver armeniacum]|nr:hypothetical protein MKW92_051583 [Papaver armeniacum]